MLAEQLTQNIEGELSGTGGQHHRKIRKRKKLDKVTLRLKEPTFLGVDVGPAELGPQP